MPVWTFYQTRVPSFWIARPHVPGGAARVMLMDDFGNAVAVRWAAT